MTIGTLAPPEPVTIRDGAVVLRQFTLNDLPAVTAAFGDPALAAWNPGPAGGDEQAMRDWISRRADWTSGDHASWAISDADGTLLGSASLFRLDADQRDGEVGYWLIPAARGKGLASRAVRLVARFAFDTLGARRLTLYHAAANEASCRVAEAAGFRLEGTMRQSHRYGDGIYHDEHVHGRLAADAVGDARRD